MKWRIVNRTLVLSAAYLGSVKSLVSPIASQPHIKKSIHSTKLSMSPKTRGLEQRAEGASPTEGGMILYLKAGPDGTSVGDCPFAHYVRLVLEEKGLPYDLKPATQETKPKWLIEHYEGKMPALQHRKECYTESSVIADYLEFFFPEPSLKPQKDAVDAAEEAVDGFFPSVAKYLKKDGDDELLEGLKASLQKLDAHLKDGDKQFLCGDNISLLDLSLAPKLYHLKCGVEGFKDNVPSFSDYPAVNAYFERICSRPSFQNTVYDKDVVLWGWGNARS